MFGKENVEKMAVEKGIFLADLTSQLSPSLFCTEQPQVQSPYTERGEETKAEESQNGSCPLNRIAKTE